MTDGKLIKDMQRQFLSNHYSQITDLKPFLDEATKEFPILQGSLVADENKFVIEALHWFKKWFGEQP